VELEVHLHLTACFLVSTQLAIDARECHVWFCVSLVNGDSGKQFYYSILIASFILQHGSELKVRWREPGVEFKSAAKIGFCIRELIQKLLCDSEIEKGPRGRVWQAAFEFNGAVVAGDGFSVAVLVVVAETEVIPGACHVGIQLGGVQEAANRAVVVVAIVVETAEPERIERIFRVRAPKRVEDRTRPFGMMNAHIRHRKRELEMGIEGSDCFGLLPRNGGVEIVVVQKVNSARKLKQMGSCRRLGSAINFSEKYLLRRNIIVRIEGVFEFSYARHRQRKICS